MSAQPIRRSGESTGVPIAEVSRVLGVPMPTLRSWELRYGIPPASREPGRHRRYTDADLEALRLMRDEIARGTRAGLAARAVEALLGRSGPAADSVDAILDASKRFDTTAIRAELDAAAAELGLGDCVDDVIFPALRRVGYWWQSGACDIDQERLTTEAVRSWIDRRTLLLPAPADQQPVVLSCGPSDLHSVGLEGLALLLRSRGVGCRVLGSRVAPITLTTAITGNAARAAVVVAHLSSSRRRAIASIQAAADLRVPTFYAGNAFASARSRVKVPGVYLGTRIQDAADTVVRLSAGPVRSGRRGGGSTSRVGAQPA